MTLQQLKYLLGIVEAGSMLKASKNFGITQPTLSAMLKKLEAELDISIFDRSSQSMRLTAMGECVVSQAKIVLTAADNLKELINEKRNRIGGRLRLGVIPTVASSFVPSFIDAFYASHPDVDLSIEEMKTNEGLRSSTIDMAVLATPLNAEHLLEIPLYYERFWAYLSPLQRELYSKSSLRASDLPLDDLWVLSEGHCMTKQIFNFCGENDEGKRIYSAGSIATLVRTVDKIGGCTIIPALEIPTLSDKQQKNIRPIENPIAVREISIVVKDDFVRERLLNDVINSIKSFIPSDMLDEHLKKFAVRL